MYQIEPGQDDESGLSSSFSGHFTMVELAIKGTRSAGAHAH